MLQGRLAELERERARLVGRASGLRRALAELDERIAEVEREIGSLRRKIKNASARTFGGVLLIFPLLGGVWLLVECSESARHGGARRDVELTVADSDRDGLRAGGRCDASVVEDGDGCRAALRCHGETIYRGDGECSFGTSSVEFWDRALDETPRFVLIEREDRALFRDDRSTVAFATATTRRQ